MAKRQMEVLVRGDQPGGIFQQIDFGKTNKSGYKDQLEIMMKRANETKAYNDAVKRLATATAALNDIQWPSTTKAGLTLYEKVHELEARLHKAKQLRAEQSVRSKYNTLEKRAAIFVKYRMDRAINRMLTAAYAFDLEDMVGAINNGAPVNYILPCGETPLSLVVLRRAHKLIAPLVEMGADMEKVNVDGYSPLMLAALDNGKHCVQALIDCGADVDAILPLEAGEDATALMLATAQGMTDMVETLMAKGANPNIRNCKGRTALMFAARFTQISTTRKLLSGKFRPDPLTKDHSGFTAVDWLRAAAQERIMRHSREDVVDERPRSLQSDQAEELDEYAADAKAVDLSDAMASLYTGKVHLGVLEQNLLEALKTAAGDLNKGAQSLLTRMLGKGGDVNSVAQEVGKRRGSVITNVRALVAKAGADGLTALVEGPSKAVGRRASMSKTFTEDAGDEEEVGIIPDARTWPRAPYASATVNRASVPAPGKSRGGAAMVQLAQKFKTGEDADAELAEAGRSDWGSSIGGVEKDVATEIIKGKGRQDPNAVVREMKKKLEGSGHDRGSSHGTVPLIVNAEPGKVARGMLASTVVVNPTRDGDPIAHILHEATFPLTALVHVGHGKGRQAFHEEVVAHAAMSAAGSAGVFEQFGEGEQFRKAMLMYQTRLLRGTKQLKDHRPDADVDVIHPSDVAGFRRRTDPCGSCQRLNVYARVRCLNCAQNQCGRCTLFLHSQPGFRHHRIKPLLPGGMTEGVLVVRQMRRKAGLPVSDGKGPVLSEGDPQYLAVVRRLARIVRARTHGVGQQLVSNESSLYESEDGVERASKRGVHNKWATHLLRDEQKPGYTRPVSQTTKRKFEVDEKSEYIGPPASVVAKLIALFPASAEWLGIPVKKVKPLLRAPDKQTAAKPVPTAHAKAVPGGGVAPQARPASSSSPSVISSVSFPARAPPGAKAPSASAAALAPALSVSQAGAVPSDRPFAIPAAPVHAAAESSTEVASSASSMPADHRPEEQAASAAQDLATAAPEANRRGSILGGKSKRRASLVTSILPGTFADAAPSPAANGAGTTTVEEQGQLPAPRARRTSILAVGGISASSAPPPRRSSVVGTGGIGDTVADGADGKAELRTKSGVLTAAALDAINAGISYYAEARRASISASTAPAVAAAVAANREAGAMSRRALAPGASTAGGAAAVPTDAAALAVYSAREAAREAAEEKAAEKAAEEERAHRVRSERRKSMAMMVKASNENAVSDAQVSSQMAILYPQAAEVQVAQRRASLAVAAQNRRASVAGVAGRRASVTVLQTQAKNETDVEDKAARKAAAKLQQEEMSRKSALLFGHMPEVQMAEFSAQAHRWDEAQSLMYQAIEIGLTKVGSQDPAGVVLLYARYAALCMQRAVAFGQDHDGCFDAAAASLAMARSWCNLGCGRLVFPEDSLPEGFGGPAVPMDPSNPAAAFAASMSGHLLHSKGEVLMALDVLGSYIRAALLIPMRWAPGVSPQWCAYALAREPELLPMTAPVPSMDGLGLKDVLLRCVASLEHARIKQEDDRWGKFGDFRSGSLQPDLEVAFKQKRRGSVMLSEAIGSKSRVGAVMRESKGRYQIAVRSEASELDLILSEARWSAMLRKHVGAMAQGKSFQESALISELDFLLGVQQYKAITSVDVRRRAAMQLKDKFIMVTNVLLSVTPDAKNLALALLRNDPGDPDAFDKAAQQVHLKITMTVLADFLQSGRGARYMDERCLLVGLPSWSLPQVAKVCEPDRAAQVNWIQRVVRGWLKRLKGARARGEQVVRGRILREPKRPTLKITNSSKKMTTTSSGQGKPTLLWTVERAEEVLATPQAGNHNSVVGLDEYYPTEVNAQEPARAGAFDWPDINEEEEEQQEEEEDYTGIDGGDTGEVEDSGPDSAAQAVSANAVQDVHWDKVSQCYVDRKTGYVMDASGWWWDPATEAWLAFDEAAGVYVPHGTASAEAIAMADRKAAEKKARERMPFYKRKEWAISKLQCFVRASLARKRVALMTDAWYTPVYDEASAAYYYIRLDGTGTASWTLPRYLPYGRITFKAMCDTCGILPCLYYCRGCDVATCHYCQPVHIASVPGHAHTLVPGELIGNGAVAVCIECDKRVGYRACEQCSCNYCPTCWPKIHSKGNRTKHTWQPTYADRRKDGEEQEEGSSSPEQHQIPST